MAQQEGHWLPYHCGEGNDPTSGHRLQHRAVPDPAASPQIVNLLPTEIEIHGAQSGSLMPQTKFFVLFCLRPWHVLPQTNSSTPPLQNR